MADAFMRLCQVVLTLAADCILDCPCIRQADFGDYTEQKNRLSLRRKQW
jgi:hypothetical protein